MADRREGRAEPGGPEAKTHCSACVAGMTERLRIYVLRPPEHAQEVLANAQMGWPRDHGAEFSWRVLDAYSEAEEAADRGELVLCWRRSKTPIRTSRATSRSYARATRRFATSTATVHRRHGPVIWIRAASLPHLGPATIAERRFLAAAVRCAIAHIRWTGSRRLQCAPL
jgi:hypothetical protein